jgi:hypothetical protein
MLTQMNMSHEIVQTSVGYEQNFSWKNKKWDLSTLNFSNSEGEYKVDPSNLADLCIRI